MCQDSITGIVILTITVPEMVKSVAIAVPVLQLANLPYQYCVSRYHDSITGIVCFVNYITGNDAKCSNNNRYCQLKMIKILLNDISPSSLSLVTPVLVLALCIVAVTSGQADSRFFEALALIGVTFALAAANHCTLTLSPNK